MTGHESANGHRRSTWSPERIRQMTFSRTTLGRRGYVAEEVDEFLRRIAEEVAAGYAQQAGLRAEVERLRNWYREHGVDIDRPRSAEPRAKLNVDAVNILSHAQQQADAYVAQAEEYCRRVTTDARQQAEEILSEAHRHADAAAEQAVRSYRIQAGSQYTAELEELERRAAWLRTFIHAAQVQFNAASEAFAREVSKLAELPTVGQVFSAEVPGHDAPDPGGLPRS